MTEASRRASAGEKGPLWIRAIEQTAGRGRRGRAWESAPEDLKTSLLLTPDLIRPGASLGERATLSYAIVLGIAEGLDQFGLTPPALLKWPNDVLLGGEKLVGLLLESQGSHLIAGFGVNIVSAPPPEVLETGARTATALNRHLASPPDAQAVLEAIDGPLRRRLADWGEGGFPTIRDAFLARTFGLSTEIVARAGGTETRGVFRDVDAEGALVLETEGTIRRIFAADVYFGEPPAAPGASAE